MGRDLEGSGCQSSLEEVCRTSKFSPGAVEEEEDMVVRVGLTIGLRKGKLEVDLCGTGRVKGKVRLRAVRVVSIGVVSCYSKILQI